MERKKNMTQWERNAVVARDIYGAHVDWEERFYECPECGEPIYEDDWSESELRDYFCPVCEDYGWAEADEDEDEDWEDDVDETGYDPYIGCYSDDC